MIYSSLFRSIHSIPVFGFIGACKLYLSSFVQGIFSIKPTNYKSPIYVRGKTSDWKVLYSVFVRKDYPLSQSEKVQRIIDAGAYAGYSSVYFAHHFPDAEIISIEPEASNLELLRKNIRNYPRIKIVEGALWSENTTLSISNPNAEKWSFQTKPSSDGEAAKINAYTMNELLKKYGWKHVDIFKVDVEGAEKELFDNNMDWLDKVKTIMIEIHDHKILGCGKAVFNALNKYFYELQVSHDTLVIKIQANNGKMQ